MGEAAHVGLGVCELTSLGVEHPDVRSPNQTPIGQPSDPGQPAALSTLRDDGQVGHVGNQPCGGFALELGKDDQHPDVPLGGQISHATGQHLGREALGVLRARFGQLVAGLQSTPRQ